MTLPVAIVGPLEPRDHEAVVEIAARSDQSLDLPAELGRSWARIWVAREQPGGPALGFLLAWRVADELHVINVATHPDFRRR
jgi:ribosomal-protein-alanine N-acetyltransferase